MINSFDNFIFDLDGTLVNSSKEVLLCFDKAFQKANYPIDYARLNTNVIGPPLYDIVKLIAPELKDDVKINEIIKYYEELYDYDDNDISSTYDGVIDLLNSLKYEGKKLYIATYKPITPTLRILNKFKLNMFDDIYTIDKFGAHITKTDMIKDIITRYSLSKDKTVMIGDAPSDVISANEAGITSVGVMWGYGTDKTSLIQNSDMILKSIDEIYTLS